MQTIELTEQLISLWRQITDKADKKNAIQQLKYLLDAENLEAEISGLHNKEISSGELKSEHRVICGDILNPNLIAQILEYHPNLIFTSPPYNANIKYDIYKDKLPTEQYIDFLRSFILSCNTVLQPGGRFVINLRDITISSGSRLPAIIPLYKILCDELKYTYRGTHIWYKGREESSFAWGSWKSSSAPAIIDLYEYIFVFQKPGDYSKGDDNIGKTEFIESVIGIWKIRPVKKIIGSNKTNKMHHPCPFPVELAHRVIKLYSRVGDTVLDPFGGVMSTAIAAAECGRNSVSVDISQYYCESGVASFKKQHRDLLGLGITKISWI